MSDISGSLPNKLSDLLELAVRDAQACEALPDQFRLNMGDWVVRRKNEPGVCEVCMAGAVMVRSLGFTGEADRIDPAKVGDERLKRAMWAIDAMRLGEFEEALLELLQDAEPLGVERQHTLNDCSSAVADDRNDDDDDEDRKPRADWATYLQCAKRLREVGL